MSPTSHHHAITASSHVSETGDALAEFTRLRPRLLGIAFRILGSPNDAEDVVQEAWLRWQLYDRATVVHPTAFLVTTTTRLALNVVQSARARREFPAGERLPEPAVEQADPAVTLQRNGELDHGVHLLLARLTQIERAAFVLRYGFNYPYARIAELTEMSETNARQVVSRAGKHLASRRNRHGASSPERSRLVDAVTTASTQGDLSRLEHELLAVA